jgi:hypothetical protein
MRCAMSFAFVALLLTGAAGSSAGAAVPGASDLPTTYPGAPKPMQEEPTSPYAMTYTDEVARNLGVSNGHMDLFTTRSDPGTPYVSGGVSGGGAMLRLQWQP